MDLLNKLFCCLRVGGEGLDYVAGDIAEVVRKVVRAENAFDNIAMLSLVGVLMCDEQ